jgi:rubrerythrin
MIDYKKQFIERMADHEDVKKLLLDIPEDDKPHAENFLKDLIERYSDVIHIVQGHMNDPVKREKFREKITSQINGPETVLRTKEKEDN